MHCKINNNTSYDLQQLEQLAKEFLPFAQERIGFNKPPVINFASDEENSVNPLGKTGHYSPSDMQITIFVDNRHIKDILRSLSHELVHHGQNCRGEFDREFSTSVGYAQDDDFLRGMEDEAYREGNFCLRDWEDGIKKSKIKNKQLHETIYKRTLVKGEDNMSTKQWKEQELNNLLMEKWGYKLPEKQLNEQEEDENVESLEEDLQPAMNMRDYSTGEKVLGEDSDSDEDDEGVIEEDSNPHSVEARSKAARAADKAAKKKD